MNFPSMRAFTPFPSLISSAAQPIAWEQLESENNLKKQMENVLISFNSFLANFKKNKQGIHNLAATRTFKLLHCPFTIKQLFILYVEERLSILEENCSLDEVIIKDWSAIKQLIAEDTFLHKDLAICLNGFLHHVNHFFKKAQIDNREFSKTLLAISDLFKYPYLTDTPLISFFDDKLRGEMTKEGMKKTFERFLTEELWEMSLPTIEFPISAIYQSLKVMLYRYRLNLIWLTALGDSHVKDVMPLFNIQSKRYSSFSKQEKNLLDWCLAEVKRTSTFFDTLSAFSKPFDEFDSFIENDQKRKVTLDLLKNFHTDHNLRTVLGEHNFKEPLATIIKKCNRIAKTSAFYLSELHLNISALAHSVQDAKLDLREGFDTASELQNYLHTQLPVDSLYKLAQSTFETALPQPEKPQSKNAKRRNRVAKVDVSEKESTEPLVAQTVIPIVIKPKKARKKAPRLTLGQVSASFLDFSRSIKDGKAKNDALNHSYWHFSKCALLYDKAMSEAIAPSDYLNVFSTYVFSAAIGIEQVYRYQMHANDLPGDQHNFHNLLEMHWIVYEDQPIPNAVQTLKLAINWSRHFYQMRHDVIHYSTFHQQKMPELLETLYQLAKNPEQVSLSAFRNSIKHIHSDVMAALPKIAPFLKHCEGPPNLLTEISSYIAEIEMPSFKPTIEEFEKVLNDSCVSSFKMAFHQALGSLNMLDSTLTQMQRTKTYEEFCLWSTRCLFLIEETTDLTLRSLDILKQGTTIRNHNIAALAERTNIQMAALSDALDKMALKLKYPGSTEAEGLGGELIEQIEALRLYPELDEGAIIAKSALIPEWKLPLKNVKSSEILANLNFLISEMKTMIENAALPQIKEQLARQ